MKTSVHDKCNLYYVQKQKKLPKKNNKTKVIHLKYK